MRMSLLLEREPLGEVLERTLGDFFGCREKRRVTVRWYRRRFGRAASRAQDEQRWICNMYLNAIFVPGAEPDVLEPVRREFSRSNVPWRRPAQAAYVAAATSRMLAGPMAQASLGVSPPVADAAHLLVIPGNHKVRLLDSREGVAFGVLKSGFDPVFMRREIGGRAIARQAGVSVVPLLEVEPGCRWYREEYVSGTPLNRLASKENASQVLAAAVGELTRMVENTAKEETVEAYAHGLATNVRRGVEASAVLDGASRASLLACVEEVSRVLASVGTKRLVTAMTHGDFQPGNVLVRGDRFWVIDWEYSGRRQATYDLMVYALAARFPRGLADRMLRQVQVTDPASARLGAWVGAPEEEDGVSGWRLGLFLLEELALHMEEHRNPLFTRPHGALRDLLEEVEPALAAIRAR